VGTNVKEDRGMTQEEFNQRIEAMSRLAKIRLLCRIRQMQWRRRVGVR